MPLTIPAAGECKAEILQVEPQAGTSQAFVHWLPFYGAGADFVILVVIAMLIATPLAWYGMSQWLQKYSYRTELSWWIFALSGAGALAITLLTVSFQSIKAALMNPVKSLRSE